MILFFRTSGIVFTLLLFLACGFLLGAHRQTVSAATTARFIATGKTGFAFDTKLGLECAMDGIDAPPGVTLYGMERCEDLAKR